MLDQFSEISIRNLREELVLSIVVMDTVTEENAFGIDHEILEIGTFTVALVGINHSLNGLADAEVVLEVLFGQDVAAAFGSFTQVIEISLLLNSELIPVRDLVAHDAQVGELVHKELEFFLGLFNDLGFFGTATNQRGGQSDCNH